VKKIYEVLEGVYSNDSLRRTIVPLFVGNPGIGKTVIIEQFAKDKGVKHVELITSQMSPFEISGIAFPDKDSKKMEYYNFDKLENLQDGDILFFDELLNGNPVVLNACLTILEQRRFISGKPLPNIMIVAAANPQGMAPLTPQIKERFVWYDVKFNSEMWANFMFKKYGLVKPIANKLSTLITKEDFTGNNFYTPRSVDKAVNMIIHNVPTHYENTIKPILETLIENKTGKKVLLEEGKEIAPNEQMSWLQLIRFKMEKDGIINK
jgi:MoxR-like ATPase